tara:strand:+ start:22 stop:744 length:723 start_codon:yes stop_codon:yes gene_type:complete
MKSFINDGINIGHSSRLGYDKCAYNDRLQESVSPLSYRLNPNYIKNCKSCISVFGPRSGHNGASVSTTVKDSLTPAQDAVDVESVLKNLNVLNSKCKDGRTNDIDVTRFTLHHARTCNNFLDPSSSRLTNPSANYRGLSINRFYDLPKPAQANPRINPYHRATNTKLEAKDNYRMSVPHLMPFAPALPKELKGINKNKCTFRCSKESCGETCEANKIEPIREDSMRYWEGKEESTPYGTY